MDFNSLLGDIKIDFECPNCNHSLQISINQIGGKITCPNCSTVINLEKDDNFDNEVKNTNDELKSLDETIKNFGK